MMCTVPAFFKVDVSQVVGGLAHFILRGGGVSYITMFTYEVYGC